MKEILTALADLKQTIVKLDENEEIEAIQLAIKEIKRLEAIVTKQSYKMAVMVDELRELI